MHMYNFSVITVVYNNKHGLLKTIQSIISQNYKDYEYIVVDGGSSDGTLDIINDYSKAIDKWISKSDNGIYDAMNKGISMATGKWLNFMNAGDEFATPNTLQEIYNHISHINLNKVGVVYGDCIYITTIAEKYGKASSLFYMKKDFIPGKGFCHQSSFVKADLAKKYLFDLKYRICGDLDMMWRIHRNGYSFQYIPIAIARYEVENGTSKKNQITAFREAADISGKRHTLKYKFYFLIFVSHHFLHRFVSKTTKLLFPNIFLYFKKKLL